MTAGGSLVAEQLTKLDCDQFFMSVKPVVCTGIAGSNIRIGGQITKTINVYAKIVGPSGYFCQNITIFQGCISNAMPPSVDNGRPVSHSDTYTYVSSVPSMIPAISGVEYASEV